MLLITRYREELQEKPTLVSKIVFRDEFLNIESDAIKNQGG